MKASAVKALMLKTADFYGSFHVSEWMPVLKIVDVVGVNDIKIPDNRFSLKSFD